MRYRINTERIELFDVNVLIVMQVHLNEAVPFDAISRAFYDACDLHEILNSKVLIEESGEAFYVDCDSPRHSISITDLSLEEIIASDEKIRFRIEEGEYIRAFACADKITFLMHHLGGDGKSLLYFIETFMKCLADGHKLYVLPALGKDVTQAVSLLGVIGQDIYLVYMAL